MIEAAFIGTIIPLLLLVVVLRHSRPMMLTFCWGMTAFLLAYLASRIIGDAAGMETGGSFYAISIAPPLEEILKSLPLFYFLFRAKKTFVPFIYIFGMAAGIGFAIEENLLYLINRHTEILSSLLLMIVRSISTCVMHGVVTAIIGFAFTAARRIAFNRKKRGGTLFAVLVALAGYAFAIGMHSAFNLIVLSRWHPLAILVPGLVFVFGAIWMKRSESKAPETRRTIWR